MILRRLCLASTLLATTSAVHAEIAADWLLIGGTVYDGVHEEGRVADVGIRDDRVVFVGDAKAEEISAKARIDVRGLIVAPGFIDPHTHTLSDLSANNAKRRANLPYLHQGVTTVVVGNDGDGPADISALSQKMAENRIGTNVAFYVGFGHVRRAVVGEDNRAPTEAELAQMKNLVASAVCAGALGLSTGLHYTPQNFATTQEVAVLAREAAVRGGLYDTHLRDESSYSVGLRASVAEALEIGRQSGAPVHIAHIKALGPDVWGTSGDIIKMVEAAHAAGQQVTADQYPWRASGTRVSNALVPRWALDGGMEGLRARLKNPKVRPRLVAEMEDNLKRRGGAEALLLTRRIGEAGDWTGKTLAEAAAAMSRTPVEAAIAILEAGDFAVASFNMHAEDILAFATRPWVMTSSDGTNGHPRKYASFPKAYQDLVVKGHHLGLGAFIRRSSSFPAQILGLADRGQLRPGAYADVVIFDPERYAPRADYTRPQQYAEGVIHLFVNGQPVISAGAFTESMAGRPLARMTQKTRAACSETARAVPAAEPAPDERR